MQTRNFHAFFSALRYAHALFGTAAAALVVFLVVNGFLLTAFRVDGHSMEPTLHDRQFVGGCLVCAKFIKPKVGDIVIVEYEGTSTVRFVKRVLGVPGDTMPFDGGTVTLADDEYFVVGDNRDGSTDSRVYGPIKRKRVVAIVLGKHAPGPGPLE